MPSNPPRSDSDNAASTPPSVEDSTVEMKRPSGMAAKAASPVNGSAGEGNGACVLVIEDDPRGARMLAAHLQSAGYRATVAHSAAAAQSALERALPDLILCDVCLPGMDGIQFTRFVRGESRTASLPIALITSSDDSKILARGLEAGADDFLSKPVNSLELRTRVRSLLRSKILADELRARGQSASSFAGDQQPAALHDHPSRDGKPLAVIIEDSAQDRRLLEAYLTEFGFQIRPAVSAATGLELVRETLPDLVVLDLLLPDRNGYDFIAALKSDPRCSCVPILVVSAMCEISDRVKALEVGADDFIVKGFERLEFEARSRRLLRLKRSLDQLNSRCDQALRRAVTDSLTGLYTRGFMLETLENQLQFAKRYGHPYAAIFADIDHFKMVNDRYGHAAGDTVLCAVAGALRGLMRQADTLVRYGGEEFVALLPNTNGDDAMALAERMRATVAALQVPIEGAGSIQVTISLGVSSYPSDANDGQTLVERGDAAMYLAKQSGRNRIAGVQSQARGPLAGARVLLVDDDEETLRGLEASLAPEGYELLQARDGVEALELVERQQPEVIIMDATMPRLGGYDACRRLKQDAKSPPSVVIMTGPDAHAERQLGVEAGVDEFISKPIDQIELVTRVRALVRHRRDQGVLEDTEAVMFAMARAVEDRDPLVGNHMERVAEYSVGLGRAIGLGERELQALRRAGRVHDLGKIVVPDAILFKPGELTPSEFEIIKRHPDEGFRLLSPLPMFAEALPPVRFHHERLDGSGYPLGLRGDAVPKLAQIVAIADVYDALTTDRHYRSAIPAAEACVVLRDEARRGLHDVRLIETFIAYVAARGTQQSEPEAAARQ
jgi:diguanylate cyclase (GGDEF)-like protein